MRFIKTILLVVLGTQVVGQDVIPLPAERTLQNHTMDLRYRMLSFHERHGASTFLKNYLQQVVLKDYRTLKSSNYRPIDIIIDVSENIGENYNLNISKDTILISGSEAGIFYGVQTLRQLVFHSDGRLPCQRIMDYPNFKWRGMHLDVSRHFFSVNFIKKYIDMLALHKMNTFHWHLTDDQGWRIEIKKYPKLTKIGSQRKETIIGKNFNPYKGDGKAYGGFYTQEEIKEVVAYAKERYITVVPEIEMPGHAVAALSAYPQFSCRQKPLETLTKWGISEDIYCSKDETFEFLFEILDEVLELFPGEYIHIGGDEAPKTRWASCKQCQDNIQKHALKDEHELQSYFIGRIDSFLTSKGRKTIGWDEILEGGLAKNAAVMSWRGEKGGIAAASQKHHVVMSPGSHCYFDHYQGDKKVEPLAIGGYTTLKKVYSYNPIPKELKAEYYPYILGAQGNVWTEYMETPEHVMYMALPRLCALSEVLWTGAKKSSYTAFTHRLIPHFNLLDTLDYNYSKALFNIEAKPITEKGSLYIALQSDFPEYEIRYTTNGKTPSMRSALYREPILMNRSISLRARLFKNGVANGNTFSQNYKHHLAVGKTITLQTPPRESYSTGGAQTLINGIVGSLPWSGNEWLGWRGDTLEAIINLEESQHIRSVNISFLEAPESWIYLPKDVLLFGSLDGVKFDKIEIGRAQWNKTGLCKLLINGMYRYLKLKAIPLDVIPENQAGSGQPPWLFCSEIIVE